MNSQTVPLTWVPVWQLHLYWSSALLLVSCFPLPSAAAGWISVYGSLPSPPRYPLVGPLPCSLETVKCKKHIKHLQCICNGQWTQVEASWNVMAHARKPDFAFQRNGWVHLKSAVGSVQSTTGSRGVRISGSNAGYTMFQGSVEGTGYPLHLPVSPSLPLPCVTLCHHILSGVY